MVVVNIHEAKTHLSRLVDRAAAGEQVVIAKSGKPIVRLVPYTGDDSPRRPGSMRGKIRMSEDFDEPLPTELLAQIQGDE